MSRLTENLKRLEEMGKLNRYHMGIIEDSLKEYEKEIRAKAIDETCLKIFNHLLSEIEWNRVLVDDWDGLAEEFKEIAEQLKGGA